MDTRDRPYIDNLLGRIGKIELLSPSDLARVLPLYIKAFHENGVVSNISIAYIDNYDGKSNYKKFKVWYDRLHEMFLRNGLNEDDKRMVFRMTAKRSMTIPRNVSQMKHLFTIVIEETQKYKKLKRLSESRTGLINRFKLAVKKYLHLTYSLGYNEPSLCAKSLATSHKIDKYIMSGDFPVILLPFLPELESAIRKSYEHYEMKDAWEMLQGRYFNHIPEYRTLAIEIKSSFNKSIPNFSDYFDKMYTDTYYNMMLKEGKR